MPKRLRLSATVQFEVDDHVGIKAAQDWIIGALKAEVGITNPDEALSGVDRNSITCTVVEREWLK